MSMSEINAIIEANPPVDRQKAINATGIPSGVVNRLAGRGINTVGALMDTDAFKTITSGRYDIETVREVNGIPMSALRWLLDEIMQQGQADASPVCAM